MRAVSTIEDEVRPGIAGAWDRFVGPGQTPLELAGSLAAVGAGALWGDHALDGKLLVGHAAGGLWDRPRI